MNTRYVIASMLVLSAFSTSAWASCALAKPGLRKKVAHTVFQGTVRDVSKTGIGNEVAVTLQVERVWKGKVRRQVTVYFVPSIDPPQPEDFDTGRAVIVFTHRLTPSGRKEARLPAGPQRTNWVQRCGGPVAPTEATIKQLGRSRAPSK